MTRDQVKARIIEVGIVPVVRAASADQAMRAAEAVSQGGIPVVEMTMTVPGAAEVIAKLSKTLGSDILVGAGTVLDAETAQRCLDAGAQFLVSPVLSVETVKLANRTGTLIMAGALTPTEIITAWKSGSDFVKVFLCGTVGGARYIKALKGPLPDIPMVPTGGVNLETATEFIQAGSAALGIGGELISDAALRSGNTNQIVENVRKFVAIVSKARRTPKH